MSMTINEGARRLVGSPRGRFLISKALHIAVAEMKKASPPLKAQSDIDDMEFMLREAFPIFPAVEQAEQTFRRFVR